MDNTKLNKTIKSPKDVKIFCPCCGKEIVSPRGELDTLIANNAEKVRECLVELADVKEKLRNTPPQQQAELLEQKAKIVAKQKEFNGIAHRLKQKRANLSGYETISAYTIMKKLVLERYGDKEYVNFMNEVMKRTQAEADDELKVISIL